MRFLQLALLLLAMRVPQNQAGAIDGIVTQSGTNFPIAGVQIKIRAGSPAPPSAPIYAESTSDGAGIFTFREIPAGAYTIEVSKEGYVFGAMPTFNATATMRIVVNPSQRVRVPISAVRAATIRGRVLDSEGNGLPDMPVEILQSTRNAQGQTAWRGIGGPGIRTNDQGEYERPALGPGQYVVRTALDREDTPGVWIYSPGTTDASAAVSVDLRDGSEITADVRITPAIDTGTYKISGKVISPVPSPALLLLRRRPADSDPLFALEGSPRAIADADVRTGKYEFRRVRPGIYDLYASGSEHLSKVVVEVRNVDVEDVDIVLHPGVDIKGRLAIDGNPRDLQFSRTSSFGDSVRDPNRSHVGDVKISLRRTDGLFSETMLQPEIGEDGVSFKFSDVPEGDYEISASFVADGRPPSPDLYVEDVRAGGRSVLDTGFQVGIDPVDAMEVVVGTEGGSIKGTIQARRAAAAGLLFLVRDPIENRVVPYQPIPITANGNDQFEFRGLRPGRYKIFAIQADIGPMVSADSAVVASGGPTMTMYLSPAAFSQSSARSVIVTVQKGTTTGGVQVPFLFSVR